MNTFPVHTMSSAGLVERVFHDQRRIEKKRLCVKYIYLHHEIALLSLGTGLVKIFKYLCEIRDYLSEIAEMTSETKDSISHDANLLVCPSRTITSLREGIITTYCPS